MQAYQIRWTESITTRLIMLTKKANDLFTKRLKTIKVIEKVQEICNICELLGHVTRNYATTFAFKKVLNEQAKPSTEFLN